MVTADRDIDRTRAAWRKSSFSEPSQPTCVEVAQVAGHYALRDSANLTAGVLVFTADQWVAFRDGVRAGEFD